MWRDVYNIKSIIENLEKTNESISWLTGKRFREISEAIDLLKELENSKRLEQNQKDYIDDLPF